MGRAGPKIEKYLATAKHLEHQAVKAESNTLAGILEKTKRNIINLAISGIRGQYFLYVAEALDRWDWHSAYVL